MVMQKRVSRDLIAQVFDAFDVFGRGVLKASECVDVANVFYHFLDCAAQSLFVEFSGAPVIRREQCVDAIFGHIAGSNTSTEANVLYTVFSSDSQAGPMDSIDVVGPRFGSSASAGQHPDGWRLDPLLLSLGSRATNERKSSKRLCDEALFVQSAASVLFPERLQQEPLRREEFEDLCVASNLMSPGANKRIWRKLWEFAKTSDAVLETQSWQIVDQPSATAGAGASAGGDVATAAALRQ